MSNFGDFGTAFVHVVPDARDFQAQLQRQVDQAVANVRVPPVQTQVAGGGAVASTDALTTAQTQLGAAAAEAAVSQEALAVAEAEVAAVQKNLALDSLAQVTNQAKLRGTVAQAAAEAATVEVAAAEQAAAAQIPLAEAIAAVGASYQGSSAAALEAVAAQQALATAEIDAMLAAEGDAAAQASLAAAQSGVAASTEKAGGGVIGLATRNKILQGSLVGLTRITPVAVFGLGAAGSAAIAAGLALKASVSAAASFEQQLNTLQAVTGATGDQMSQIADKARALGNDLTLPGQSALDAAVGMTELSKAGLSVNDTLAASKGVLQLATAANIDVGTAANIAATQLNAFQLSGDQATRVAELLADASIAAQGEITDFAAGFQQVAAVANQTGLSVEQTTALLTELGKAGLKGADGGTSLRTTLLRLVPTTKQAAQYVEALGVHLDKSKSIGQQLNSVIDQYRTALQSLTPIQQQEVLTQIFGQDAIRAASIIFGQQADELQRLQAEFAKTNSLQALSEAKSRGLSGAANNLSSELETLALNVGSLTTGPLAALLNEIASGVGTVNEFADSVRNLSQDISNIDVPDITIPIHFKVFGHEVNETVNPLKEFGDALVNGVKDTASRLKQEAEQGFLNALFPGAGTAMGVLKPKIDSVFAAIVDVFQADAADATNQIGTLNLFGGIDFGAGFGADVVDQLAKQGAAGGTTFSAADLARQARIAALQKQAQEKAKQQIPVPLKLREGQIEAQLSGNLNAEVAADNKIIAFFKFARQRFKNDKEKFVTIGGQLVQAQNERDSVVNQIQQNRTQAKNEADKKIKAAADAYRVSLQNTEARLSLAAQTAGANSSAEKNLIAFFRRESQDSKLTTAEQLQFASKLANEQKQQTSAIKNLTQAEIARQIALKELAVQKAETLTPNNQTDDTKAINSEIALLRKLQRGTVRLSQEWIDYESKITTLKGQLLKGATGGGPSLSDLFTEATKEFNDFASNVSSSVLSPGGVRASFAASVAIQNTNLSKGEADQINLAAKTNDLLGQILTVVKRNPAAVTAGKTEIYDPVGPASFATASHARSFNGLATG